MSLLVTLDLFTGNLVLVALPTADPASLVDNILTQEGDYLLTQEGDYLLTQG